MFNQLMGKMFQSVPRCSYNIVQSLWKQEEKMNLKTIAITLIITLFLTPTIHLINAQEYSTPSNENESIDPEIFVMVKTQAENREQELQQLFSDYTLSYAHSRLWEQAQQAMELARNYEENSGEAANQYLRALKHFRNILRNFLKENPEALETETLEITSASEDIPMTMDKEIIITRNQLLFQFQEQFLERLNEMLKNIDDIKEDISPIDLEKAQQSLIRTEEKVLEIQQRIQIGEYEGIIDELDEATKTLDEDFDELDPDTAQMLRTLNKLEAEIQKISQISVDKAARGEDTSKEDALLKELRGNKDKMKGSSTENKGNGSQGNGN